MGELQIERADITQQEADAIVNAANSELAHGGGVARAIAHAAGPEFLIASRRHPFVPEGGAGWTPAGALPCRYVIHAVGPRWRGGISGEPETLASAYRESLSVARELGCNTLAFPSISTGIFGYPTAQAAQIAVSVVSEELEDFDWVRFCLFSDDDLDIYKGAARMVRVQSRQAHLSRDPRRAAPPRH